VTPAPGPARRAVFLDVDGTYAAHGEVPPGHEAVVRAARANGHLVLLCTGRPRSMVAPRVLRAGFDGLVLGAGCHVLVGDEVLADRRFPGDLAVRVLSVLDAHDVAYVLESPDVLLGRRGVDARLARLIETQLRPAGFEHGGPTDILEVLVTTDDLDGRSFGKAVFFDSPVPGSVLEAEIGEGVHVERSSIPGMGDSAGEISVAGVHKAVGVREVVEHFGLRREDVVAVGDGPNDVDMLEYAGLAVAVEGADPALLAVADRTVPGPDAEGLVELFGDLGLV
jgi:Cof subfamily protein (haloacid dehalogenase superfamily)